MIKKMQQFLQRVVNFRSSEICECDGGHDDINMADGDQTGQTRTSSYISLQNHSQNIHINQQLVRAVCRGDVRTVRGLIRDGADLQAQDVEGRSAFYLACELGHDAVVEEMMRFDGQHIMHSAYNGWTALHIAAYHGDVAIVRCLLRQENQNQADRIHRPKCHHQQQIYEYRNSHQQQFTQSQHEKGSPIDIEDSEGRTALHIAADLGHTEVILALLAAHPQLNKRDIDGATPLILAASHGHLAVVELLTKAGCELDERNCEGRTALMEAVLVSQRNIIRHLIHCGCHVNVMDNHGYSAISDAVCAGDMQNVNLLIEGGTDVDIQDSRGRTSLHLAIMYGYNAIASRLVDANCNLNLQDMDGYSMVFLAAWDPWDKGTLPTLQKLAMAGADLDQTDYLGVAPLTKAWARKDHVITLIQHGCQVNLETQTNLQTPYGFSLMELAAMEGDQRTVHALLVAGFNASVIDFTTPREKYQQEYDELHKICLKPLTLKEQCRLQIRKNLGRYLQKRINLLPLPVIIKHYLCMEDL